MNAAKQVVSALIEGDYVRHLIRAGLPRSELIRRVTQWIKEKGWEVISTKRYCVASSIYGHTFRFNPGKRVSRGKLWMDLEDMLNQTYGRQGFQLERPTLQKPDHTMSVTIYK